jgi:hypothetical protein
MSILDNLPHTCDIYRRDRTTDALGGAIDTLALVSSSVKCWEQGANSREVSFYDKKGLSVTSKFYFTSDPNVDEQTVIKRDGRHLEVRGKKAPDASAGLGVLWRVFVEEVTSLS